MNTTAHTGANHGAHAVETHEVREAHAHPVAPVRHAVVDESALDASRPVDGWGFFSRVIVPATVLVVAFELFRVVTHAPTGSVAWGTDGRGWVTTLESMMFGMVGGALAAAFGYGIVLMMGGAARSAARYLIGGVVGGFIAAALLLMIFSNTAVETIGFNAFWLLPLAGLIGGAWAGLTSAKR